MSNGLENIIRKFDSYDYYLSGKIARDIEENRKGQFVLRFKNKNEEQLDGVHVKIRQKNMSLSLVAVRSILISTKMRNNAYSIEKNSRGFLTMLLSHFIGIPWSRRRESLVFQRIRPSYPVVRQLIP